MTQEGVGHEGGEERHLSVGLAHLHLSQLHLDGLGKTHVNRINMLYVVVMVESHTSCNNRPLLASLINI